jgi:hypothetical protein
MHVDFIALFLSDFIYPFSVLIDGVAPEMIPSPGPKTAIKLTTDLYKYSTSNTTI